MNFSISSETYSKLSDYCEQQFLARLRDRIRSSHFVYTETLVAAELDLLLKRLVAEARAFSIEYENDIFEFICTVLAHSFLKKLEYPAWVIEILANPNRTGRMKVELLKKNIVWRGLDNHA